MDGGLHISILLNGSLVMLRLIYVIGAVVLAMLSGVRAFRIMPSRGNHFAISVFVTAKDSVPLADKWVLSKSDVISILQQRTQFHKHDITKVLNSFTDIVYEEVFQAGKEIRMKEFGSFKVYSRAARDAHNPRTREVVKVPAKKTLKFSPSSVFKTDA